jgi:hypothetical protein
MNINPRGVHMTAGTVRDVPLGGAFSQRGRTFMRLDHSEKVHPVEPTLCEPSNGQPYRVADLGRTLDWVWCVSLETGVAQRFNPTADVTLLPDAEVRHG